MRKVSKNIIALVVVLTTVLNFSIEAFAQDPFSSIAIGGIGGASGAGLFGSMAGMSGIDIAWNQSGADPLDAMWNVLNPDHVYFSGEKHEATGIDEDVWDYITVDLEDWLDAQSDFIINFAQTHNVQDNSSGNVNVNRSYGGYSFITNVNVNNPPVPWTIGNQIGSIQTGFNFAVGSMSISIEPFVAALNNVVIHNADGTTTQFYQSTTYNGMTLFLGCDRNNPNYLAFVLFNTATNRYETLSAATTGSTTSPETVSWTSGAVDTSVFDGWENAKVKIPHSISGLPANWTIPDFTNALNDLWDQGLQGQIVIEDTDHPVPPPQPIPDTPLGDVPFEDWVDLWGQSIWEQLTRLEEKQELMVINQETGLDSLDDLQGIGEDLIEDVDDLIGLETDINENLEDMVTYEQGISEDVEDINENVEDIEDEVIVIVDEMGNVIDVLEGLDAKAYAQGQKLGEISTEVGTIASTTEAISTEVEAQTETQEDIEEAVEDMVPYVAPLPDIATDTETMVDILPDIATATQTSTQTLTDTLPDIKDATQTMTDTLPDIITEIQDATTTLTDDIPNIDDICENIDEAPYKDLDTGLDRLPRFLLPFITDLRSALGIWHYVTEWLAQISTTFAFISGCLVGTSIMTPIYAAIAGFMCIKIYRRMTT